MKFYLLVPFTLCLCVFFPSDAKMENAKDMLQAKLGRIEKFSAHFEQTVFDKASRKLQTDKGTLLVQHPNKFRWQSQENTMVSDGETIWFVDPMLQQVQIMILQKTIANTPFLLITGHDLSLWQDYKVTQKDTFHFLIESSKPGQAIRSVAILFDDQDRIQSLTVLDAQENKSIYQFDKFDTSVRPKVQDFKYTIPNGYTIDDQRS